MERSPFDAYLGLDQTGAVDARGNPKPYPAAVYFRAGNGAWHLRPNLHLANFRERDVRDLLRHVTGADQLRTLIAADVAIGTPEGLGLSLSDLLRATHGFHHQGKSFGMATANEFFRQLWRARAASEPPAFRPARFVDIISGANSAFEPYPFQKNIACGSYRFLRELSEDPRWCRVWPFQSVDDSRFVVAESFPTLIWREVFNRRFRAPSELSACLREKFPAIAPLEAELTPDHADAAVLAVGSRFLVEQRNALAQDLPPFVRKREGWILGLAL